MCVRVCHQLVCVLCMPDHRWSHQLTMTGSAQSEAQAWMFGGCTSVNVYDDVWVLLFGAALAPANFTATGAGVCLCVCVCVFPRGPVCCAVLCCAVLCCAVLCCAVLCCAVLCCAVLCCAVLC